ncbi:kinase, putative [Medicago truncatula]|uniref:Kinase, putative n=1 Tax=Medicago truncatula TaxID=3880 RepID=G7J6Q4_MEDTR|nr:kinase, putative [Medicago truncatula]
MVCIENVLNAGREKEKKKKVHKCNERGSLLSCTYSMIIMGSLFCATTVTLILILDFHIPQTKSQQDYLDNFQLDCDVPSNYTYGNICNSTSHSNQTLLNTTLQPPQGVLGPSPSKWKMDSSIFLHTWSLKENEYPELIDELLELTVYNFEKLHKATSFFGEAKTIKGSSVYRACLKGNASAVKVLKSGVSTEMNILRRINHANITKLSGKCLNSVALTWKQRVQIAQNLLML